MHLSNESLLVILFVGIVAGWLAGRVMEGGGFGLIGDLIVGLVGAFIGNWLLPQLGIHLGVGLVAAIIAWRWRTRVFDNTGQPHRRVLWFTGVLLGFFLVGAWRQHGRPPAV